MDTDQTVNRMDLLRKPRFVPPEQTDIPPVTPAVGMSMEHLQENYHAILRSRAIHYPVAYQFLRQLGRGRQGRVFLGLRQGARGCITEHAIKIYSPDIYRTPKEYWTDMGRIASQISRLHRVQSPNLIDRHSYDETNGIGYVQMEAVDGMDLQKFLNGRHLETVRSRSSDEEWERFTNTIFRVEGGRVSLQPGVAIYIMRKVLRGLEMLHSMNFLHGDIKPANIMIDRLGYIRVVDFGRAVIAGERLNFLLASPQYMAPEIHRREAGSTQSDLYALGIVGLEMLRGVPLMEPGEITEKDLLNIKMTLPAQVQTILPPHVLVNQELVSILVRFIEPDAAHRHGSAKEAEAGSHGLLVIGKQLVQAGLDTEYERDISDYMSKLVDPRTNRVEMPDEPEVKSTTLLM